MGKIGITLAIWHSHFFVGHKMVRLKRLRQKVRVQNELAMSQLALSLWQGDLVTRFGPFLNHASINLVRLRGAHDERGQYYISGTAQICTSVFVIEIGQTALALRGYCGY